MAKEKAEFKPEEHISPEQYAELVKLFNTLDETFRDLRRIARKIFGRNGRPHRYKKSVKQTAKEVIKANIKTRKDVAAALAGTLPVELPASLSPTPEKIYTGADLGLPK
jgi:hypothetical protein